MSQPISSHHPRAIAWAHGSRPIRARRTDPPPLGADLRVASADPMNRY
jgi:hypothetical protein